MKTTLLSILLLFSILCKCQDTLLIDHYFYKGQSISLGYNYSFSDPNENNYHLLESRFQKQTYGGMHPVFHNINAGLMVGLNTESFLVSPVVGGMFGYGGFFVGVDLAYFTDFNNATLRLIPMFGFGFHQFRISLNPHIRLTNTQYEPVNRIHLNITFKLFKLKKERL